MSNDPTTKAPANDLYEAIDKLFTWCVIDSDTAVLLRRVVDNPIDVSGDNSPISFATSGLVRDAPNYATTEQPRSIPNDGTPVFEEVIEDICDRANVGASRYGTFLQPGNGRDALVDLYQELIDAVMYIRQMLDERNAANVGPLMRNGDTLKYSFTTHPTEAPITEVEVPSGIPVECPVCGVHMLRKWNDDGTPFYYCNRLHGRTEYND